MTREEEIRFERFKKSRLGRMIDLAQDVHQGSKPYNKPPEPLSNLACALWIAAKGTKLERD